MSVCVCIIISNAVRGSPGSPVLRIAWRRCRGSPPPGSPLSLFQRRGLGETKLLASSQTGRTATTHAHPHCLAARGIFSIPSQSKDTAALTKFLVIALGRFCLQLTSITRFVLGNPSPRRLYRTDKTMCRSNLPIILAGIGLH